MNAPLHEEELSEATHWVSRTAFPAVLLLFILNEALLAVAIIRGWYWLAIPLVLIASHFMHGLLITLHEASHGLLGKDRIHNEIIGSIIGLFTFCSFSLYRAAHQSHHAHLSTERDEELWPFVIPTISRWRRMLSATLELNLGLLYTPFLFLRAFLRKGSAIRNVQLRRRIRWEFALMLAFWVMVFALTAWLHTWKFLLWMHFAPAFLAGNLQSWRKYIEHVGMTGATVNGLTRSIVARGWSGFLFSFTLLHEPYHGIHHRHAGLTYDLLPGRTVLLQPREEDELPPFAGYRHALLHLARTLLNPRAGSQWRARS